MAQGEREEAPAGGSRGGVVGTAQAQLKPASHGRAAAAARDFRRRPAQRWRRTAGKAARLGTHGKGEKRRGKESSPASTTTGAEDERQRRRPGERRGGRAAATPRGGEERG